jgi:hypothetical protein
MQLNKVFIKSVAVIILITATLKILTLIDGERKLDVADPLFFFFSNRELITLSIVVELVVVCFLFARLDHIKKLFIIFWLSGIFFLYHLGLWVSDYKYTCYCAGTPFSWLVVIPFDGKEIIRFLLGYMLIGSGFFLLRRPAPAK